MIASEYGPSTPPAERAPAHESDTLQQPLYQFAERCIQLIDTLIANGRFSAEQADAIYATLQLFSDGLKSEPEAERLTEIMNELRAVTMARLAIMESGNDSASSRIISHEELPEGTATYILAALHDAPHARLSMGNLLHAVFGPGELDDATFVKFKRLIQTLRADGLIVTKPSVIRLTNKGAGQPPHTPNPAPVHEASTDADRVSGNDTLEERIIEARIGNPLGQEHRRRP